MTKARSTKVQYDNIMWLTREFEDIMVNFTQYHQDMVDNTNHYNTSAFYPSKPGRSKQQSQLSINLLKTFADKNIQYTSTFPKIKTVPTATSEKERNRASTREKVVLATHRNNNSTLLQKKWAGDATVRSIAIAETDFDLKDRCVKIKRLDPRYCYWQWANDNDTKLVAFWVAFPMTKDQIEAEYGVTPTVNYIDPASFSRQSLSRLDGKDWFMVIRRLDDQKRLTFVGDKWIEEPNDHKLGTIPIDVAAPFDHGELTQFGDFYLRPLLAPQAEFNETIRRMANIVRRLGNPAVWGRGIVSRQFEDVKKALQGDGGFIGLKAQGELGILQVPETRMLHEHLQALFENMKHLSGFGSASFGESVGANTSGDALNLYFQPTTRAVENQQIVWNAFYESINYKILKFYSQYLRNDEKKRLTGYLPRGTFMGIRSKPKKGTVTDAKYQGTGFDVSFGKEDIGENYDTVVTSPSATPKDDVNYKRLIMEAVNTNFISRVTGYEEFGIMSPQDELQLLEKEQENSALNPEGTSQVIGATAQAEQAGIDVGQQRQSVGFPGSEGLENIPGIDEISEGEGTGEQPLEEE